MAKGSIAKTNVVAKLEAAFGADYIGEFDKKVYVFADDGGERVQIAIAMTCPKNEITVGQPKNATETGPAQPVTVNPATTPEEEQAALDLLYEKLGFGF